LITPDQISSKYENRKDEEQKFTGDKLDKLERQKQTYLLDLQGFQNKEISEKLHVSLSTIEKDLNDIREESKEWFKKISKSGLAKSLVDAVLQIDYAQKELWSLYREETQKQIKIKILNLIIDSSLKKKGLFWNSNQKPSFHGLGVD